MVFFRLDPITRKRARRFRQLKRGYYSLLILLAATFLSLFAEFLANGRAIVVKYQGKYYFPTFRYYKMAQFGQEDIEWGLDDAPVEYRRLKEDWAALQKQYEEEIKNFQGTPQERRELEEQFKDRHNWLIMPPIPWDPLENDLNYYQRHYSSDAAKKEFGTLKKPTELTKASWKAAEARWLAEKPADVAQAKWLEGKKRDWLKDRMDLWAAYSRPPYRLDWGRQHYLGTDSGGRDVASRLLYGFPHFDLFRSDAGADQSDHRHHYWLSARLSGGLVRLGQPALH
jgi:ABC-type microcin C transport system permease subunit YejE